MYFRKYFAEFIGSFVMIFIGCGAIVLFTDTSSPPIGALAVSIAFGLAVMSMYYSIGSVSGCHLNPIVSMALTLRGRFPLRQMFPYIAFQVFGAIFATVLLYSTVPENSQFLTNSTLGAGGVGLNSPGGYSMIAVLQIEIVTAAILTFVVIRATAKSAPVSIEGMVIGLTYIMIYLFSMPVSNASINPAKSVAVAIFAPSWALTELWIFIIGPIAGAVVGTTFDIFLEE